MSLSSDLISQFVKATAENKKTDKESTVYGTAVEYNGSTYVKLDGSDLLTPISTTTDVKPGERVTVMIKNHTATVTGNISSPAARTDTVKELGDKVTKVETLVADKVSTEELEAEKARIDTLVSDNVTIKETLTANEASISELTADVAEINELKADKAEIDDLVVTKVEAEIANLEIVKAEDLEAINADIHNLEVDYGDFKVLTTNTLSANSASIDELQSDKLSANEADLKYATIEQLEATNADVKVLDADVADINTLIFGSATGTTIQTEFSNAVIAQLGDAQIKSAMIDNLDVNKINSGTISTDKFTIASDDGKMTISDNTIQISDGTKVRVQIGKDASNDYSINIWDAEGNLMFSEGGITDSAIKEAIIRNDMVSNDANIDAKKLDINSLFTEINGSTNTIKSTKVYLDDEKQTLDVAFKQMDTTVTEQGETISSQGTSISTIQGQISSKIWQQDITTAVDGIEIGGRNLFSGYGEEEIRISDYWDGVGGYRTFSNKLTFNPAETVGETYTISLWAKSPNGTTDLRLYNNNSNPRYFNFYTFLTNSLGTEWEYFTYTFTNVDKGDTYSSTDTICNRIEIYAPAQKGVLVKKIKVEKGNKATDWTPAPEDMATVTEMTTKYSELEQSIDGFKTAVGETYATKTALGAVSEATLANTEDLTNYISATNAELENLQGQIDGSIMTWFYEYVPTNSNYPASDWTTTDLKNNHLGDLFYDLKTGYCYRWQVQNNTYSWNRITDVDVTKALADAKAAQDTADNKRRVFVSTPTPPYDVGDLWSQGTSGDLMRCQTAKTSSQSYAAADWVKASKYTDDTKANAVQANVNALATRVTTAETSITQNKEEIALRATKTEVTEAVNNITIGGRNLLLDSATEFSNNDYMIAQYAPSSPLVVGEKYTVSLCITPASGVSRIGLFLSGGYESLGSLFPTGTNKQILTTAFTAFYAPGRTPEDSILYAYVQLYRIPNDGTVTDKTTIHWIKVEKGNKATDWTPAPEDMATGTDLNALTTRVTNAESSITQNADSITSLVSRTETVENKFSNYSTTAQMNSAIEQSASAINATVESTQTQVERVAALNLNAGKMLYTDPTFTNGANSLSRYNNHSNSNVTVARSAKSSDNPITNSEYELVVTNTGNASPGLGGVCWQHYSRANAIFVYRFIAKIPTDYRLIFATNSVGDVSGGHWLTDNVGTGRFVEYIYRIQCGASGSFSTTGYFYINGGAYGTTDSPVKWYLAYATCFDVTGVSDTLQLYEDVETNRNSLAELKITADGISSRVTEVDNKFANYSTTAEMNSAIEQKADSITSTVSETYATKTAVDTAVNSVKKWQTEQTIDLTDDTVYDEDKWYPVVGPAIPTNKFTEMEVSAFLATSGAPSWGTHSNGFAAHFTIESQGSGWGATKAVTRILQDTYSYCAASPISYMQLTNSSAPVFYLRGGGKYTIRSEQSGTWTPYSTDYTWTSGNYSQTAPVYSSRPTPHGTHVAADEDLTAVEERVTSAESSITQLSDKITANVTETTNLGTRMSTVEQTAEDLTVQLENLEIGGRNLWLKTKDYDASSYTGWVDNNTGGRGQTTAPYTTVNGFGVQRIAVAWRDISQRVSIEPNTDYTLSAWIKWESTVGVMMFYANGCTPGNIAVTNYVGTDDYKRVSVTFNSGSNTTSTCRFECTDATPYLIYGFKLEKGNKATDWTPAPEDVDSDITDASKTATNYLNFSSGGLVVGDMTASTLGKNVLIDSDSVDIRNSTTTLASFGANKVTLGRNAEDSVIDLCNGAGTISANTSEAATSYPYRDAILMESQELEFESVRHVATATNVTDANAASIARETIGKIYMLGSDGGYARIESESYARSNGTRTGAYTNAVCSTMALTESGSTQAFLGAHYSSGSSEPTYNYLRVYPTKTTANKPIYIDGTAFTGKNKVLWSGTYYMSANQTATLSEAITSQVNGIVLLWSEYTDGASVNANFNSFYVPKQFVTNFAGKGVNMILASATFNVAASKYVYITNTAINGYGNNGAAAATKTCGILTTPTKFVLRYVIGV